MGAYGRIWPKIGLDCRCLDVAAEAKALAKSELGKELKEKAKDQWR